LLVVAATVLSVWGCSDEHGHDHDEELPAECDAIRTACHRFDQGTGPAHDCHELAHHGNAAHCAEQQESCLEACAADGGADGG
jgi:hypothetical protein